MTSAAVVQTETELFAEFERLVRDRKHNLTRDMVHPTRTLTAPQLRGMISMLERQPRLNEQERMAVMAADMEPQQSVSVHEINARLNEKAAVSTRKTSKAELEAQAAAWEARWDAMGTPDKIRDAQREARELGTDTHHGKIPDGRYAIANLNGSTDLNFYSIKQGKGNWANTTFVDRIIGGHPEEQVRNWDTKQAIFREIRKVGIEASQILAAHEIKQCRDCGSDLTNPLSRMLCQGPVCGGRS